MATATGYGTGGVKSGEWGTERAVSNPSRVTFSFFKKKEEVSNGKVDTGG
jgi:hypothetical protein